MHGPPDIIMEDRASSFFELKDDMSPRGPAPSAASRSKSARSRGQRQTPGRASQSRASRATTVYNEQDANAMILRANAPPNYSGGFDGK